MANAIPVPRRIPRVPGHPFLGNLLDLRRDRLGFFLRTIRDYGEIAQYRRMSLLMTLLSSPVHIQTVLVEHAAHVGVSQRSQRFLRPVLGNGLLTSDPATHAVQRDRTAPVFQPDAVAHTAEEVVASTLAFRDTLVDGATIDIFQAMKRLALRIVGKTLFGVDVRDEADAIGVALTTVIELTRVMARSALPLPLALPTPMNRRFQRAVAHLNAMIARIIAERRQIAHSGDDVLSLLMQARGLSDTQVRDEAMTIFLAGYETLATALTWTWYLLAQHPSVYAQLRDEVDAVLAGRMPTMADIPHFLHTRQIMQESLRLYPPIHLIARQVGAAPIDLVGGYQLPAGAYVVVSIYALHRRPEYFPNPEQFAPDRWTPSFEQRLPPCAYLPFGVGPRRCLGDHFATLCMQLILTTLTQLLQFESPARTVAPRALLTLRPSAPIDLCVRYRS